MEPHFRYTPDQVGMVVLSHKQIIIIADTATSIQLTVKVVNVSILEEYW